MIDREPEAAPPEQLPPAEPRPSLRQGLRGLGATYLRVAHYLALRVDLLTPAAHRELLAVGEHLPATPWADMSTVLTDSLGAGALDRFSSINGRPVTSGVFTQVHRARLLNGTPVAIKLQRPDAPAMVARDWERAPQLETLLRDAGLRLVVPFDGLLKDIKDWLQQELDLEHERANIERLGELAADSHWEHIPRAYPKLCSSRVLVTDDVEGIPCADLLVATGSGRPEDRERMHDEGMDQRRYARNLGLVNLRQIFRYRFFQVDFHPRNVIVLPDGRISFADMSHFGELDVQLSEQQLMYLSAIYDDDLERVLDPPVDVGWPRTDADLIGFRRQLVKGARARVTSRSGTVHDGPETWADRSLSEAAELVVEFLHSAVAHDVELPEPVHLLYRSVVSAQQTASSLEPNARLETLTIDFLRALQLEVAVRRLRPNDLQPTLVSLLSLARDSPTQVQKLLSDLADGSFVLNVYASEASQVSRNRDRRTRVVVGAICSVSLALLLTVPNLPQPFGVSVGWLLSPVLGALYAWLFFQWRRLR